MEKILLFGIACGVLLLFVPLSNAQEFEKATFQETLTIIYDEKFSESTIVSVGFETISNEEIRFPDEIIQKINDEVDLRAVVFTNAGECVIGVTSEQQCIMINFDYEKLKGDGGIRQVQDSAREKGSKLIDELNQVFRTDAEFHSTFIHTSNEANLLLETSGVVSGRGAVSATYVTDKRTTDFLFKDLAGTLIPREIRDAGGFYDIGESLSQHDDAIISITVIPNEDSNLYIFKISREIKDEVFDIEKIDLLQIIGLDEISRSSYFDDRNVPLNSVIHLIMIPNEPTKLNAISTHAITDLTKIENLMKKGWFLSAPAGDVIDLRFLFGTSKIVSSEELLVETLPWDGQSEISLYSVEDIEETDMLMMTENEMQDENEEQSQYVVLVIIIAVGIAAAIFYLKGYRPKR